MVDLQNLIVGDEQQSPSPIQKKKSPQDESTTSSTSDWNKAKVKNLTIN